MAYKKCPRCNLNYIKDTDVLCGICLEEVGKALRRNEEEEEEYDICPECGENIIKAGEEMCYPCRMERSKEDPDAEIKTGDWDSFSGEEEDARLFEEDEPEPEEEEPVEEEPEEEEE